MPKHPLFYQEQPEDKRNRQESQYEEKLTSHLLTRYGLASYKSKLRQLAQKTYDDSRLKVGLFVEMFDYPVQLGVVKMPVVKSCSLDKLYNRISTRKIIEHYFLARDESQSDKPFALVVPWTYIPKGMVIHERNVVIDELPSGLLKPCVRMIWTLPKKKQKRGKYLVLEPLDQFLSGIDWKYEE
jgi:hypothetical protein